MDRHNLWTAGKGPTAVPLNPQIVRHLNDLILSEETLKRAGYIVKKLSPYELLQKKRCPTCGTRISKRQRKPNGQSDARNSSGVEQTLPGACDSQVSGSEIVHDTEGTRRRLLRCNFHPGKVILKAWTCCGKHVAAAPCAGKEEHDMQDSSTQTIERRWQFHETPSGVSLSHRLAVAIDCEMGSAFDGDSELIRLSLIDYFSGEILIDSLVYPDVAMKHFNTRWSGITRADMERSRRQRRCIMGRDAARRAVLRYVGPSTIVIGHGARNDLSSLRWIHLRVIDSLIVESERRKAVELLVEESREGDKPSAGPMDKDGKHNKKHPDGSMSLKSLAEKRLGRTIQAGKGGHDSLEDALAARDLIHAHVEFLLTNGDEASA